MGEPLYNNLSSLTQLEVRGVGVCPSDSSLQITIKTAIPIDRYKKFIYSLMAESRSLALTCN
jgi:hypothetical protein